MVEWFKVVLQWDPKKRGKQLDINGTPQLVVFKLLEPTLLQKVFLSKQQLKIRNFSFLYRCK